MPDALSKTIPIWCAVINRALFPKETAFHPVQLPPNYLGESEESQIENRIEGFVSSLKVRSLHIARQVLLF
jgi:tRNA A64-2'-O-ribosylphosphate transferase